MEYARKYALRIVYNIINSTASRTVSERTFAKSVTEEIGQLHLLDNGVNNLFIFTLNY